MRIHKNVTLQDMIPNINIRNRQIILFVSVLDIFWKVTYI